MWVRNESPPAASDVRIRIVSDSSDRIHSARNLLATIIGNLDYAKTIAADENPTPQERTDLAEALDHARLASSQLLLVIEEFR